MDPSQPRFGGPTRRRSFTPAQKLDHVAAYEAALDIMGKTHALLEEISKSAPDQSAPKKR